MSDKVDQKPENDNDTVEVRNMMLREMELTLKTFREWLEDGSLSDQDRAEVDRRLTRMYRAMHDLGEPERGFRPARLMLLKQILREPEKLWTAPAENRAWQIAARIRDAFPEIQADMMDPARIEAIANALRRDRRRKRAALRGEKSNISWKTLGLCWEGIEKTATSLAEVLREDWRSRTRTPYDRSE